MRGTTGGMDRCQETKTGEMLLSADGERVGLPYSNTGLKTASALMNSGSVGLLLGYVLIGPYVTHGQSSVYFSDCSFHYFVPQRGDLLPPTGSCQRSYQARGALC